MSQHIYSEGNLRLVLGYGRVLGYVCDRPNCRDGLGGDRTNDATGTIGQNTCLRISEVQY